MGAQLDAVAIEKTSTASHKQFYMRGADEMREVNVVGQALANAVSVFIERSLSGFASLLGHNGANERNQQGSQLDEFS